MSDEEEYCDLETLEALLETDDMAYESPAVNSKKALSQEMQDFINSMPEESDDEVEEREATKQNSNDESVRENSQITAEKSEVNASDDDGMSQQISTSALQKELLMMQKKMAEMQKLLDQQQSNSMKMKVTQNPDTETPKNKNSSSQKVISGNSSGHNIQNKKLHLIMDDDENPFIEKKDCVSNNKKKSCSSSSKAQDTCVNKQSSNFKKTESIQLVTKALTSKELFGDSDSDWDDLDGEKSSSLNEQGKNIKRLLQAGQRDRQANKTKFSLNGDGEHQRSSSQSWANKLLQESPHTSKHDRFSLKCKSSSNDQIKSETESAAPAEKIVIEDFSRIRIVNPLVSSAVMRMRMDGRKLIYISKIHSKINSPDLQGDWVTIGVIVGKTNSKTSNSGKTYTIWKLNDLHDLDNSASFFLFGEVYKAHWKMDVGSVIGLLNPSMMEAMEKGKSEPAFTIKNPNQLMVLGQSKDLGWCLARTKKGNKCSCFINKKQGDFCSYHVQAEYKKTASKRLELQGSVTGIQPKSFEQKIFSKNSAYMYGGKTYLPNAPSVKSKSSVTLSKLQKINSSSRQINTLSIQNIKPTKSGLIGNDKGRITEDKDQIFMDMLTVPSSGAMNFVAHLKSSDNKESNTHSPKLAASCLKQKEFKSVSATDLLKQHKQEMKQKQVQRRRANNLLSPSEESSRRKGIGHDPLKSVPTLGKGLSQGQDVSLSISPPSQRGLSGVDRSKLKAISLIQRNGGIGKEDPNAVRNEMDHKKMEAISKQLDKDKSKPAGSETNSLFKQRSSGASSSEDEPPKKKSRFLGDIDLNSSEVKAILKAKSKYKGALAEAEAEREETFFSQLEKKEKMEEKMKSVTSIEINVYTCKQCKYTAQSALAQCKTEGHTIAKLKTKKRFFACKKCKERTTTITSQFPTDPCKKCGSLSYEKTSMYKEKSGPKLESEILSHRGDEIKFLNALDHKVYLNTVVDK